MKRRTFLSATAALTAPRLTVSGVDPAKMPDRISGLTLAQLRDDYRDRLFNQYLPFWEKGGLDREHGGFVCELNDDGSVASDEKYIWYQGRGIWVYSFLFNEFDRRPEWLEIARRGREFMVKSMYAGSGKWNQKVRCDGSLLEGLGENVYGWLFAAMGLAEYHRATGQPEDLNLAKESLWAAMTAYDEPGYTDTHTTLYTGLDLDPHGLRSQGHSMVTISTLTGLLNRHQDTHLEELQRQHVDLVMRKFWNPEHRIVNEFLLHDYSRAPAAAAHMLTGHSVETLWIVMAEALRQGNRSLFDEAAGRVCRFLELCWDNECGGWADGNYHLFATDKHPAGPEYGVKTMWAQCEAMVACLMILEHTGADWAREWYERLRAYTLKVMPVPGHGVWRQAVDRSGKDLKRVGVSTNRKDNFHQARYLMLNLLSLNRMIARNKIGAK
jgi:N-acylglucosamine 2-epimerase